MVNTLKKSFVLCCFGLLKENLGRKPRQCWAGLLIVTFRSIGLQTPMSTMFLIERFYMNHIQKEMEPPKALRQSQLWLRNLTANELLQRSIKELFNDYESEYYLKR